MSTCTVWGGPMSRPGAFFSLDVKPEPITTVGELLDAANARFRGRKVTASVLAEAEQWRMAVAPLLPVAFEGEYQPAGFLFGPRSLIGITLVDTRA